MNTELVEPILRGIAHPHTALTEEELAQVRADLALVEPHACTCRTWRQYFNSAGVIVKTEPVDPECGKPAVVQRMTACGHVGYRCAEHNENGQGYPTDYCIGCNGIFPVGTHTIAVLPL